MFSRPVDPCHPIAAFYGEKSPRHDWSLDPENGFWIPIKLKDGQGQHRGTDFECFPGTIVRAMCDGIIVRARHENAIDPKVGKGLYIMQVVSLPGFDSWKLTYSHLKAVYVAPGQKVFRNDAMAESGSSGAIRTPYLHVDLMNIRGQWKPIPLES